MQALSVCEWVCIVAYCSFEKGAPLQWLKEYASLQRLTMHSLDYPCFNIILIQKVTVKS